MSLRIYVDAYSGYKAIERPQQFVLDEAMYEIAAVLDQWYEPSATYFKVQSTRAADGRQKAQNRKQEARISTPNHRRPFRAL